MDVAQLISVDSPVAPGDSGRDAVSKEAAWGDKHRDLQARVAAAQRELLALAATCDDTADQLQFETECQAYVATGAVSSIDLAPKTDARASLSIATAS